METLRPQLRLPTEEYEKRYAVAKMRDSDRLSFLRSMGLSINSWDELAPEERFDIEDFFLNSFTDLYRAESSSENMEMQTAYFKERFRQIYLQILARAWDILHSDEPVEVQDRLIKEEWQKEIVQRLLHNRMPVSRSDLQAFAKNLYDGLNVYIQYIRTNSTEPEAAAHSRPEMNNAFQAIDNLRLNRNLVLAYNLLRHHDYMHCITDGREYHAPTYAQPMSIVDRYTKPEILAEELYPILFLPVASTNTNVSLAFSSRDFDDVRVLMAEYFRSTSSAEYKKQYMDAAIKVLNSPLPTDIEGRQKAYELIAGVILIQTATFQLFMLSEDELSKISESIFQQFTHLTDDQRPLRYRQFAHRVFSGDFQTNRRLFIDQFLADIRLQGQRSE